MFILTPRCCVSMVHTLTQATFFPQVRCLTLFVTHYPVIVELEEKYPLSVGNFHMAYVEVEDAGILSSLQWYYNHYSGTISFPCGTQKYYIYTS